jgi:FtsH-binding integral membrane protein
MATAALPQRARTVTPAHSDRYFFSGMALLLLATVVVGFARTYFLAGVFHAPLPSVLVHVHGALFSLWILLLITQTALVSVRRVDIHRRLGLAGFILALLMVVVGTMTATGLLARDVSPVPVFDAKTFYAIPMADMLIFAVLILFGYLQRKNPAAHKRLVMIATIALMDAPTGRPPFAVITHHQYLDFVFCVAFLLMIAGYDLWSKHKVQRATILGGLVMILVDLVRVPVGMTAGWHSLATWAQHLAQSA